ncbi:hypothetical protein E4T38_08642 [Aureobasidium subglaciale]|nr:hypothetical protein E4T38_08642 [Aureobasidium subglaciale]KAI5215012.1 hypothetical protein E4T40_08655 [Aureobasidium subglaciale]KAI5218178.1 hypothetical protein E4T41_08509 [Aureobasidium subglaciale]KAI5255914.1 hypothetical protein E4T46_08543 [Aureobasidium subglaciale]
MALSNGAIIVIVIVCCGAFVCCLGAVGWVYRRQDFDQQGVNHGWQPTNDQSDYMREIRQKNQKGMLHAARYHKRSLSSQPSRSDFTTVVRLDAEINGFADELSFTPILLHIHRDSGPALTCSDSVAIESRKSLIHATVADRLADLAMHQLTLHAVRKTNDLRTCKL